MGKKKTHAEERGVKEDIGGEIPKGEDMKRREGEAEGKKRRKKYRGDKNKEKR